MSAMSHQARRGPSTTPARHRLGASRQRVLEVVSEHTGKTPITLAEIVAQVGGHPNTSRQHLDALLELGLLSAESLPRSGPGRRPLGYTLTAAGRAHGNPDQDHELEGLVEAFASYLVRQPDGRATARAVGELWGEQQASQVSDHDEPVEGLVELLDMLGFAPTTALDDQGPAVLLTQCPLVDAARENPGVVCEMHRGMVDGVMRTLGARTGLELLPFSEPNGCGLHRRGRGAPAGDA